MKLTPKNIKRTLRKVINEISTQPELYAKNLGKDFSRNRKLPFKQMVYTILSMAGKSLPNELMEHFGLKVNLPTVSAFVQQRNKITCNAFEVLFNKFNSLCNEQKLFKGYRLLAADGSDLHTPTNIDEQGSYYAGTNGQKPYNLLHLNALYDLLSNTYVDAIIQNSHGVNEYKAFCSMVDRDGSPYPTIYIGDRGYESYNNIAHIQEKGQYFLFRIKDFSHGGIALGMDLPINGEFDISTDISLTRKQTNEVKNTPNLKILPKCSNFDFLPLCCKKVFLLSRM
ncbi:MAG: transposase [Clostridia bacterium]|nr:transposase [Clostridia bacterium]